jgi:4-hydroxy-tetrahydrodipicolinate reductase
LKFCTTCGAKAPATVAAEEQARLEAEAKARREAEDKARLQAEARARRDAEEQAQIEANRRAQAEEQARVDAAAKVIPVVQSGNYSLGVNLILELVRKAATILGPEYDIEVTEMHHRHKKDAPSGTALMLARAAALSRGHDGDFVYGRAGDTGERPKGEIAVHALRGGSGIGDHTVMFAGDLERIELTHKAQNRAAFAAGALTALVWAKGRAVGLYTMRDVLGFSG